MRDLLAPAGSARNGRPHIEDPSAEAMDEPATADAGELRRQIVSTVADHRAAAAVIMVMEASKRLRPLLDELAHLVDKLSRLSLRWATLGLGGWFTFYALSRASLPWEREILIGVFFVGAALTWKVKA